MTKVDINTTVTNSCEKGQLHALCILVLTVLILVASEQEVVVTLYVMRQTVSWQVLQPV